MARLTGHAVVWGARSVDLGGFVEVFRRGAFSRSLREGGDVFMLDSHRPERLAGSRTGGTLRLSEDDVGLRFELETPDTNLGRDLAELVRVGTLRNMSFGFRLRSARGERWSELPDGRLLREVLEAELIEVSTTAFPAYPQSSITASRASRSVPAAATPRAVRARGLRRLMAARLAA